MNPSQKIIMRKVKENKTNCTYEAPNVATARGKDRPIISTMYLNKTFGPIMPDVIEVTITPGVRA